MWIGDREIVADGEPGGVYVIAEIGVNHDGSVDRALSLTEAAAGAGADAVKLQLFETDLLLGCGMRLAGYQREAGETDAASMLRRLELSVESMGLVVERAHALGVHAIVTVFSPSLVARSERLGWDAYKSASPDVINRPLLEAMAGTGRPLIVSTGASTLEEVVRARSWLDGCADRLAVLHCVSCYPTVADDAFIDGVRSLRGALEVPVGYSDHTAGVDTGGVAVSRGAVILEKHLTYDRRAKGPDHAASLEPDEFARYVKIARDGAACESHDVRLGTGAKRVLDCERDVRAVGRQSVTSVTALERGTRIERDHVTVKRPGTGIEPFRLEEVVGKTAVRDVPADSVLTWEDVS